jgi:4'-phosphopantetheinyl transferase
MSMQIAAVSITRPVPRHELAGWLVLTGRDKSRRLERFHRDEDLLRGLLGDLLARHMIGRRTGLTAESLIFGTAEFGKPFLVGPPGLEVNVSHSGAWVACAVDGAAVGVDVEQIRPIEPDLSRRFFSAEEDRQLRDIDPADRLERFFTLWTLKESYIKMTGQGLTRSMPDFSVVASTSGGFAVHAAGGPIDGVYLATSDRLTGHRMAVCGRTAPPVDTLEIMPMEQLLALLG